MALKVGDKGKAVREVQARLEAAGYPAGGVDGTYGKLTKAAVIAFQADHKLSETGTVNDATAAALEAVAGVQQTVAPTTARRPCSPLEAVQRAQSIVGRGGQYKLSRGDYRPQTVNGKAVDLPWTGDKQCDCSGFANAWCFKIPRKRDGFNSGSWSSVSGYINTTSSIEDAKHEQELYRIIDMPEPGDLLVYPGTPKLVNGKKTTHPGHVALIEGLDRASKWDPDVPDYALLDIIHCTSRGGGVPAVTRSTGSIWKQHDKKWPQDKYRSVLLRVIP